MRLRCSVRPGLLLRSRPGLLRSGSGPHVLRPGPDLLRPGSHVLRSGPDLWRRLRRSPEWRWTRSRSDSANRREAPGTQESLTQS